MASAIALRGAGDAGFTRAQALRLAGVSASALLLPATQAFLHGQAPLRRSAFAPQVGARFTAGGTRLTLVEVADLSGSRAGDERAFSLLFRSAGRLPEGIHRLRHPRVGAADLFVSPVGRPSAMPAYQAIVNRSQPRMPS